MVDDMSEQYNGWKNYETWGVALVMSNEEGIQRRWQERAAELKQKENPHPFWTDEEYVRFTLSDEMSVHVEEMSEPSQDIPEYVRLLMSQLIGSALGKVDWGEIAASYMDE